MPPPSRPRRIQPARGRLFAFTGSARARAFTLLEVLAVMVIVGIVLTFATLAVDTDSRAREMEREAQRLLALLQLAGEEAVLRSEQLALRVGETNYEFMILHDNEWVPLPDDRPL